jgi:hypothetical protein
MFIIWVFVSGQRIIKDKNIAMVDMGNSYDAIQNYRLSLIRVGERYERVFSKT